MGIVNGIFVVIAVILIWLAFEINHLDGRVKELEKKVDTVIEDYDLMFDNVHQDIKIIREHLGMVDYTTDKHKDLLS